MYPILSTHWKFDQKKKKTYLFEAKSEEMIAKKKKAEMDQSVWNFMSLWFPNGPQWSSPLIQQEKVTAHQLDHTLLVPTWKTTPRFSPSPAATNRRIPPLAAAAEGLAMTTAPHELIGSRRAVGEEASTAVEETPAAGFCRR